jgi:DNA-binding NtrC family response regulator
VADGRFRADLYYRINVIAFDLPPLSERPEDIPLLVEHFIEVLNAERGRAVRGASQAALVRLMRYGYPGNIRELRNIVEHAYVLCRCDELHEQCLPPRVLAATEDEPVPQETVPTPARSASAAFLPRHVNLRVLPPADERALIEETLRACGGRRGETAVRLGINPATLWRKMKKHGLP